MPVQAAMDGHPEFVQERSSFFLGKQLAFFNHHQAVNLLHVALKSNGDGALEWYRRIRATQRTQIRVVAEIYGLYVKVPVQLSNGVCILPVSMLPDSPNSSSLKGPRYIGPGFGPFMAAAAMVDVGFVEADLDHEKGHARFLEVLDTMRRSVTAFVLSKDAAPTMAQGWQEFVDPELEAAVFGRGWTMSRHEGRHPDHPSEIDDSMISWVEKYLRLPPDVAAACRVPLERLNLARRRISAGDKAIDGSVCLEALLSGKARGELTHRLSVRTALLLGKSLAERTAIRESVQRSTGCAATWFTVVT